MPNNIETFHALDELIARGNARLDEFDTITFDVFDTLLIRRVPDPDMVKIPTARLISDLAAQRGISKPPHEVRKLREVIENRHRQENGAKHPDFEANYDEFMPEILHEIFGETYTPSLFEQVAAFEVKMESAMIVARVELADWIKQLSKMGKRLLLISDIYLPAKYIKKLVENVGLLEYFEEVISSADSFQAKASGAAWPLIEQRFKLDKTRWLHIGDNPISDGARPVEAGIHAMVLKDIGEHHRLSLATRYNYYAAHRDFWKGRNLLQWALPLEAENQDRDALYSDGHGFLGYLLCYFIHRLIERCKDENIQRIYFCAREGWMFKQIWDELAPWFYPEGGQPESRYLYVSRMALASAACGPQGLSPVNAQIARFPAGNRDFKDICRIFKLDTEGLQPHLERHQLSLDDAIGFNHDDYNQHVAQKFSQMLLDEQFQAEVKAQTSENHANFIAYLKQEGFFELDKIALVDIGWLGTIQHYLSDAIEDQANKPEIAGFMLGAIRMAPYRDTFDNHSEGLVFDAHRLNFFGSLSNSIKPMLEEVCRAPHPTTMGYESKQDKMQPVFRHTDDATGQGEIKQSDYYAPLHQGILDFAKRYGPAARIYDYNSGELKPWLNFMYLAKVAFPKSAEIKRIRHQAHQDDFFGAHKPSKKAVKFDSSLWTANDTQLRFNPLLRLKWFLSSTLKFLKH